MALKKMKRAVGIDIGSHFVKIVSLLYNEKNIELEHAIVQRTPKQMISNGVIQFPDDLGEIVLSLLQEHQMKVKSASVSIPVGEESALLKWTSIPNLKPKEMQKAIQSIVEDELSHPPDTLYYNWEKIGEGSKDKQGAIDILLVGVLKTSMDSSLNFLKKTKIKPYYAEADIFSSIRSIIPEQSFEKADCNKAIIEIRANDTIIAFIQGGKFSYMRSIPLGANNWIQQIMDIRNISFKEAEDDLLKNGCVSDDVYSLSFDQQTTAEILNVMVDTLSDEIRNTLEFYRDYSKGEVDDIFLTGGGARISGINDFIQNRLNIPCSTGKPTSHLEIKVSDEVDEMWPSINTAFGLALKEVRDNV